MNTNKKITDKESKLPFESTEQLLTHLKYEDERYYGLLKRVQWIFIIMIPVYLFFFVLNPSSSVSLNERITGICYTLSFIVFFLIYRHFIKIFSNINYGEPLSTLLKSLINRYKVKQAAVAWCLIPVLLMDIGLCFSDIFSRNDFSKIKEILYIQLVYWPVMILAAGIGLAIWRYKYKPLIDSAKILLKELE